MHVWSERYDRDLKDVLALQDEVTLSIMRALRVKLTDGEQARLWHRNIFPKNLEAYEKYLQGRMCSGQVTKEGNATARSLYEESMALDPGFVGNYNGLAITYVVDAIWGWSKDPRESTRQAYKMANKVLALDDSQDTPDYVLGLIYVYMGEHDKAIAEGERAVELNPNGNEALAFLGCILNFAGRPEEAITLLEKAMRLNPIPRSPFYAWLGTSYMLMNQNDQAIAIFEKRLRIQRDHTGCLMNLAAAYSLAGRREDALKTAAEFLRLNPKFSLEDYGKMFKDAAAREKLINALRQAGLK